MLVGSLLFGCAFMSRDVVSYHTFHYPLPPADGPNREESVGDTLMVYRFLLSPEIDSTYLELSKPGRHPELNDYQRWKYNPADMITDLIIRDLDRSGIFGHTVGQLSNVRYRYAMEGKILDLRGLNTDGKCRAVIEAEVELRDFEAPLGGDKTVMKHRYPIEIPCEDCTPRAVVKGLNEAVQELSNRLRKDLRSALFKEPPTQSGRHLAWAGI